MEFLKTSYGFLLLLFLGGCAKKNKVHQASLVLYEARMVDVPFPLGALCCSSEQDLNLIDGTSAYSVCIRVSQSLSTLREFYNQEMELLGWRLVFDIERTSNQMQDCPEYYAVYEKPRKNVLITVRPVPKSSTYEIYYSVVPKERA